MPSSTPSRRRSQPTPPKVDAALDLLMVIKYLERIGDRRRVNVAEWVQFVRTGRYKDESMF